MIVIPCAMFPGGFSGEIGFEIKHADGEHTGLASRRYFLKGDGSPLGKEAVTKRIDGFIVVRILEEGKNNSILVSVPDGEVVTVKRGDLLRIAEPAPNVPVGS